MLKPRMERVALQKEIESLVELLVIVGVKINQADIGKDGPNLEKDLINLNLI